MKIMFTLAFLLLALAGHALAQGTALAPLQREAKIPLGNIKGRIDHLAVDLARQRLFVAELGNDSLGVVDLKARKLGKRIAGLKEPQGVGYVAATDTVYVANAGDGADRCSSVFSAAARLDWRRCPRDSGSDPVGAPSACRGAG